MNGWLVILSHTMDDLPLGLFETEPEAKRFAEKVKEEPTATIRKVYNTDASTPVCVRMIEFRKGKPVSCVVAKDFEKVPA